MNRLVHALPAAYAAGALYLAHLATVSQQHGSTTRTVGLGACSLLLALAIAHHAYSRDQTRQARTDLERASRPLTTAQDLTVADLLPVPCCEAWWTAAGGEHHCTRKDQTT
ncbi:hypothetical protein [Streptomyces antibioticus]|uniref:hypothetical protein n=1 Tax=Streptomyces antibioticus TaxID=1890 RepID=UPI0033BC3175